MTSLLTFVICVAASSLRQTLHSSSKGLSSCERKHINSRHPLQRSPRFYRVTPDNTPQQLSQALYDGPTVEVLLHDSYGYSKLEAMRADLDKVGVRAWDLLHSFKVKEGEGGSFAKVIAANVGAIIECFRKNDSSSSSIVSS